MNLNSIGNEDGVLKERQIFWLKANGSKIHGKWKNLGKIEKERKIIDKIPIHRHITTILTR